MALDTKFTGMQLTSIPSDIVVVTPSDSADLANRAMGFLIGATAGNIVIRTGLSGSTKRTIAVAANQTVLCEVTRIESTNTTATPIYALIPRS